MGDIKEILQMIETVDFEDTRCGAVLDEIDARVWCWLNGHEVKEICDDGIIYISRWVNCRGTKIEDRRKRKYPKTNINKRFCAYTRSRDALKAIRPKQVSVTITAYIPLRHASCTANLWSKLEAGPFSEHWTFKSPEMDIEELAELHAILQAIAHERSRS